MKQLSAIFLVLAMVLALTACGKDDDRNNGGSPNRPDTNQSQNAPQDNGSGGSWQNGTDTPAQPGAGENRRNGEDTLPGTQAEGRMDRSVLRRGADIGVGHDLPQPVTFFAKTAAVSAKNADGRRENRFFALRPLAFLKKWAMIWEKEYVPPRAAEKRRVYYDKN